MAQQPYMRNSILWSNTTTIGPQVYNNGSTSTITYSDVQGGYTGTGNINTDPSWVPRQLWRIHPVLAAPAGSPPSTPAIIVPPPTSAASAARKGRCDMAPSSRVDSPWQSRLE